MCAFAEVLKMSIGGFKTLSRCRIFLMYTGMFIVRLPYRYRFACLILAKLCFRLARPA